MKIDSYSYVFSGLDPEPCYAAATSNRASIWAAADGSEPGAAKNLVQAIDDLAGSAKFTEESALVSVFDGIHPVLQRMKEVVSAAGVYSDGTHLHMFNIGNARAFVFCEGYLTSHTEDHSAAYREYLAKGGENPAAYDRIRSQENRLDLWKVLGFEDDGKPQFYPSVPLRKNMAALVCTEPFWRYLSVIEMELDYRKSAGPEEWLKIMIRRVLMKSDQELDNQNFAALALMTEE